ncbi:hypothetical protein ACQEUX_13050 [Micromonospora sp. CA-259024]|uniref:hypothetical protein n=1 Tax=Micromonospora sp. CA-259024 TaxID=3239965 RepID=UPI003D8AF9B1
MAAALSAAVVAPIALLGTPAAAAETPLWQVEIAKIPATRYQLDAKASVIEGTEALRPYVGDDLGESRLEPVQADVKSRYFDGARLNGTADAAAAFDNLKHLEAFLKSRMTGASPPSGEAEQGHVTALVKALTGVRLLADAAIQDAEATIGPFRRVSPPPPPAPAGIDEAFADLEAAKGYLAKADEMLVKANVLPATIQAEDAWESGFRVLTRFGITYEGDHDNDGVVDVVELRFGSSPLLADSDGDELTDKFEITALAGWTRPNAYDTDNDTVNDGAEDLDGDGLTNLEEQRLGTSPTEADTDGDGLNDGAEVAKGTNPLVPDQPRAPPVPGDGQPINPNPTPIDTDGDGVRDLAEEDLGSDPTKVDTDGDGLSDSVELDYLISALNQDTDNDGLRDDYEISNAESKGLHPGRFDEQISKWTYVTDFLLGMFAGDFAEKDSMAWLAGNLCASASSVIPVVGWITGTLADIRDTVAAIIHGDWVSVGFNVLGLVPYVGDAVAIPAKVAKFVAKYAHRLMDAARYVARYDKIPDTVKELTYELIMPEVYNAIVAEDAAAAFAVTASAVPDGWISKKTFDRLLNGKRTDLKRTHEMMTDPDALHVDGPNLRWAYGWQDGETILNELMASQGKVGRSQLPLARPDDDRFKGGRDADFGEELTDGWILHEVKSGFAQGDDRILEQVTQCEKDAWYMNPDNQEKIKAANAGKPDMKGKGVKGVHWHFVGSGSGQPNVNDLGMTEKLFNCLKTNKIPFTIHFPVE